MAEISDKGVLHPVSQKLFNVRLGKGVENFKKIEHSSLDKCLEILKKLKKLAQVQQSEKLIAVGTEVFRKAENRDQILKSIRKQTGLEVRVLSEKEEAEASFSGAVAGSRVRGEGWVVDVGGGSTEIIFGKQRQVIDFISMPLGAVGLTEKFIKSDPPSVQEISDLRNKVFTELNQYSIIKNFSSKMMIGVGGTITTAAAIHCNLKQYDPDVIQGKELRFFEIQAIVKRLCVVSLSERQNILSFDPERADIIIAGLVIVQSIMEAGNFQKIRVSDLGVRFGLAVKELTS